MLTFGHNGKEYEFDQNKLDLSEAIAVKVVTGGMTIKAFQIGMQELDPEALKAIVWLAKRRAGEAVKYDGVTFDVVELMSSMKQTTPAGEATETPTEDPTGPPEQIPIPQNPEPTNDGAPSGLTLLDAGPSISPLLPTS